MKQQRSHFSIGRRRTDSTQGMIEVAAAETAGLACPFPSASQGHYATCPKQFRSRTCRACALLFSHLLAAPLAIGRRHPLPDLSPRFPSNPLLGHHAHGRQNLQVCLTKATPCQMCGLLLASSSAHLLRGVKRKEKVQNAQGPASPALAGVQECHPVTARFTLLTSLFSKFRSPGYRYVHKRASCTSAKFSFPLPSQRSLVGAN